MAPPSRIHQGLAGSLYAKIFNHIQSKKVGCKVYVAPFAVKLFEDDKTWVEPDISVICQSDKLTDRGCEGAPDWIIEIVSESSKGFDYVRKLALYQEAGVREYWIVDPLSDQITVYPFWSETPVPPKLFSFSSVVPAGIYDGELEIDFAEIMKEL